MTLEEIRAVLEKNHIPASAKIMMDEEWECSMARVGSIYYNERLNQIVLTTGGKWESEQYKNNSSYYSRNGYELLYCIEDDGNGIY